MYDKLEKNGVSIAEISKSSELQDLLRTFNSEKMKPATNRTSKPWLQYMDMVFILQQLLRAERCGDWKQHRSDASRMLPYFAASGHSLYLKAASIYLKNKRTLNVDHPDVYQKFMSEHHVIRRTQKYWSGLSTDLTIERVLMRSIKSTWGLTRGRGLSENLRLQRLLSMPACLHMNTAMQHITIVEP